MLCQNIYNFRLFYYRIMRSFWNILCEIDLTLLILNNNKRRWAWNPQHPQVPFKPAKPVYVYIHMTNLHSLLEKSKFTRHKASYVNEYFLIVWTKFTNYWSNYLLINYLLLTNNLLTRLNWMCKFLLCCASNLFTLI